MLNKKSDKDATRQKKRYRKNNQKEVSTYKRQKYRDREKENCRRKDRLTGEKIGIEKQIGKKEASARKKRKPTDLNS